MRTSRIGKIAFFSAFVLAIAAGSAHSHGDEDHGKDGRKAANGAPVGPSGAPQRLADGSLFVPKPLQRQIGVRTVAISIAELSATFELNGRVIADPETSGRVQATFAGVVLPGPKGMPVQGRKVRKGEIVAYLRPVGSAIERGNQRAQLAELDAQLALAEGRARRLEQLEGAVPQKEIEAARIERAALQKRREFVSASLDSATPLLAPVGGVISASHHLVAGQVVDAKEVLFEIVDASRLAVEALAYDAGIGANLVSASALADQATLALQFVGAGMQLREQALPLLFRIAKADAPVAVGQPVKVIIQVSMERSKGAAVPRSALVRTATGESAIWVHDAAEHFTARKISQQSLDAKNVAVLSGLAHGDRVVVQGAGLLSQVR